MSYTAFGNWYDIPTKSTSALIPDMTLSMDIPVGQIAYDVVNMAWPDIVNRLGVAVPGLVNAAWPGVVSRVGSSAPALIDAVWPAAKAKVEAAWVATRPAAMAEVQSLIKGEEKRLAWVGAIGAAAGIVIGATYLYFTRHRK